MNFSTFSFPTTVLFGEGAVERLPVELRNRRMTKPLIVTDRGLAENTIADRIRKPVPDAALFSDVYPNPTELNVLDGLRAYTEQRCDSIIGLGGGSPIDAAKAIRLKVTHHLDLAEYDDNIGGDAKITSNLPPY